MTYLVIFLKLRHFIKDLENPDDMVQETLQFQGIRTNKELRQEYNKKKGKIIMMKKNCYIINFSNGFLF